MPSHCILVVDDDADVRSAIQDALTDENYNVQVASDGVTALEYLSRSSPPSVILLDLMMPRGNGVFFLEQKKLDPRFAHVPVIVLSADSKLQQRVPDGGAYWILTKPVPLDDLLSAVERACQSRTVPVAESSVLA